MKNIERLSIQAEKQQQQQMLMKNLDRLSTQSDKQQHQVLMKYIEILVNDKSTTTSDTEGSTSK